MQAGAARQMGSDTRLPASLLLEGQPTSLSLHFHTGQSKTVTVAWDCAQLRMTGRINLCHQG